MTQHIYYTAIGQFRCKRDESGRTYPVVVRSQREYGMDLQEMTLWSCLNWRRSTRRQAETHFEKLASGALPIPQRNFDLCLERLISRGLVASGAGDTGLEALYDLLGGLYVVPLSESLLLRLKAFLKMTLTEGENISRAARVFRRDRPNDQERQVIHLSRQALLSTAELIKCVESGVSDISTDRKLMNALYGDLESTSDNLKFSMRCAAQMQAVTVSVANLYLRKQIILEAV